MEIIKRTDYWINNIIYYWHGEVFSGSYKGMRYHFHRYPMIDLFKNDNEKYRDDPNARFIACVWPEPYCYEATKSTLIEKKEFFFTPEGMEEARRWVNNKYDERRREFEEVMRH